MKTLHHIKSHYCVLWQCEQMQSNRQHCSAVFDEACITESPLELPVRRACVRILKVTKQIYCISLNMLDRRQSRVLEINRYSICIFWFFYLPPFSPHHNPPCTACTAAGTSVDRTSS